MENYNLRPCPFCGGKAIFKEKSPMSEYQNIGVSFKIECSHCGTTGPKKKNSEIVFEFSQDGSLKITKDERAEEAAIWNGKYEDSLFSFIKAGEGHDPT